MKSKGVAEVCAGRLLITLKNLILMAQAVKHCKKDVLWFEQLLAKFLM